ncbi:bifunctional helix-turn-helix transcriptional regulator/GNAT family N-acetyltransferase [Carbonactinospora thermoautotrophica]|uniref:bifunctional helix-turn-helix transcriptional regulator/GNAT family N-acetyltransferase n=1 Tax=Carbonactinospora thermoautotrophica TaxID=1469144 RepID=UPI0018E2B17F|nr:helix-turn-helix domain-containing GNAT family N-acetyltransferase [Carbonactinospora thermoautotrophica]
MKSPETLEERVDAVRAFTRFYTNLTGVLREGLLHTPYSLTEARVIFELAQRDATEIATLRRTLDIDSGYLSRILARFAADGLIAKERSRTDARRQVIRLTGQGRAAFELLDTRSAEQFRTLLARLPEEEQRRLVTAMGTIRQILEGAPRAGAFVLRPLGPGDLGWVVYRHGVLYAEEYGWDETFEALVARIVADYVDHHDPQRENAWIAEVDGEPAGCVFCVKQDDTTAKLRLLLVEPRFRGMGIGSRLVEECIRFARRAGYREMVLWTNDVLVQARRIYERAGFELVEEEKHHSFGQDLVGQTWRRALAP